ncbi:PREDICTED: signal peptidase complex subunit 1-like [Amphimedon queenslandica]|uniref:Signal peptidase complex subunit 1 n=1 Tax=Amphimedon queenslandica TaxID=400682 RepID=A0A1X7V7F7_AMPQE|nr:PREDICTED: signal peptidase complex subunit 1-like [Amphimedon queenslandica]|eukprot:XP_003385294.1 PREDICTED: signal peptidase complex subunit 1-like [Amphimedon queenslandica]
MEAITGRFYSLLDWIKKQVPHLDYEGQRLAEKIYHYVIILFSVVGLIWGYIIQQFDQTVYIILAGFVLAAILVLAPWPWYRRHPLPWQQSDTPSSSKTKTSGKKGRKK